MRLVSFLSPNGSTVYVNVDRLLYVAQAENENAEPVDGVTVVVLDCGHEMSWVKIAADVDEVAETVARLVGAVPS